MLNTVFTSRRKFYAFTLIELIVVMGILAILATIVVIAVNPGRQFANSRNAKRANDTRAIAQALDQYAAASNGNAFSGITTTPQNIGTSGLDLTSILVPNYLSAIPKDPSSGTDANTKYVVFKDANERISVVAVAAELGMTIGYGATPNIAARFISGNSQVLSIADNPSLSVGDIDFTFAVWVYFDSTSGNPAILSKWAVPLEYVLYYVTGSDRFSWSISNNGSASGGVNSSSAAVSNAWNFVVVWHDSVNNMVGISLNNGAATTAAWSTGVYDGTTAFELGKASGAGYLNGRLDNVGFWKRTLTSQERTELYNGGRGLNYGQLTSALKTNLVSWWNLDEDSGIRRDSHGSNHLSDPNIAPDAPGV